VKYSEKEFRLTKESKENKEINQDGSIYNKLTEKIGLYRKDILPELKKDKYRLAWRNQLLGESMTKKNHRESKYEYFTSIFLYPQGNDHFGELIPAYKSFLNPGYESSFMGITYEEFIKAARDLTQDQDYLRWAQYLEDRYIVNV